MLTRIYADNFKSLCEFKLKLGKFNCIIGLNGSGKSTVLQLISFCSAIIRGEVDEWLRTHLWGPDDVASKLYPSRKVVWLELDVKLDNKVITWGGAYNLERGYCTVESVTVESPEASEEEIFKLVNGRYINKFEKKRDVYFKYKGSILSVLSDDELPVPVQRMRDYLRGIHSYELMTPNVMRTGTLDKGQEIGPGGLNLSSYIHKFGDVDKNTLLQRLQEYFPQVLKFETKVKKNGLLALQFTERFYRDDGDHIDVISDSQQINDGMLRILILLAYQRGPLKFQLFDEIENGVNPEITESLMDSLVRAPQQTLVTTHSPMVLNYLDDDRATESVILVYKRKDGKTKATHLFKIPSAQKKLEALAPGEAMVDLYLADVAREAELLAAEGDT